jgi:hypothetical protein
MTSIPSCEALMAANPTSPTNGTICKLMQESGAGLGSFIEFLSSPVGSLILILVVVAIVGAFGFAIARVISGFMNK